MKKIGFLLILIFLFACQPEWIKHAPKYDYSHLTERQIEIHKSVEEFLYHTYTDGRPLKLDPVVRIDSVQIDDRAKTILVDFNKYLSYLPMREAVVSKLYSGVRQYLEDDFKDYTLTLRSLQIPVQDLVPNFFRTNKEKYDTARLPKKVTRPLPLVRRVQAWQPTRGLEGRNIAVWNSHGWYYNRKTDRWEWQRPRLFQTVEDLLPTSFVLPYLIPMLEQAGALVFDPRERDIQRHMVIVDNDQPQEESARYMEYGNGWQTDSTIGFAQGLPPYSHENPFILGTVRRIRAQHEATAEAVWHPEIPEIGRYAVYVSYAASESNVTDAHYTVFHAGGQSDFFVNQQIGGSTWVYLGTFLFKKGAAADSVSVRLTNFSNEPGNWISADGVRFGGGSGNVFRAGRTSGRPRFEEAARYNLQFSGFPDSLVWDLNGGTNDYNDDYQSRGEYVNYLKGAPFGPNKNRMAKGMGIPMDLSLAFHTDAGITANDTVIGTLAIYSLTGADTSTVFPDSVSRLACRDFADVLQTQVVGDIRAMFDPAWNRRSLYNANYSEAYRPNVPAMILELLSHQNFRDMQFALDPAFRFTVSRAIYKAMLKYLNTAYGQPYTVQPLPVTHVSAVFDSAGSVLLHWKAQPDLLEPTAMPKKYKVYTRIENNGFDNGVLVGQDSVRIEHLKPGVLYSFKITALNAGGESFPSEILSVCRLETGQPPVLIVNGFDRISAPAIKQTKEFSGFVNFADEGVPDRVDMGFTGAQNDFNPASPFRMNDASGHGNSYADYETRLIAGNRFDYPFVHGQAIRANGYSFVSVSDEAFTDSCFDLSNYKIVDLILGEERTMPWLEDSLKANRFKAFPEPLQKKIRAFTASGGNLFVSGAYVGTDLFAGKSKKDPDVRFGREVLHIQWVTNHAARTGAVFAADSLFLEFIFNQRFSPAMYKVEAPDAINPAQGARTILRYRENEFSAGTAFGGTYKCVVFGFPFESINSAKSRSQIMQSVFRFFMDGK